MNVFIAGAASLSPEKLLLQKLITNNQESPAADDFQEFQSSFVRSLQIMSNKSPPLPLRISKCEFQVKLTAQATATTQPKKKFLSSLKKSSSSTANSSSTEKLDACVGLNVWNVVLDSDVAASDGGFDEFGLKLLARHYADILVLVVSDGEHDHIQSELLKCSKQFVKPREKGAVLVVVICGDQQQQTTQQQVKNQYKPDKDVLTWAKFVRIPVLMQVQVRDFTTFHAEFSRMLSTVISATGFAIE